MKVSPEILEPNGKDIPENLFFEIADLIRKELGEDANKYDVGHLTANILRKLDKFQ